MARPSAGLPLERTPGAASTSSRPDRCVPAPGAAARRRAAPPAQAARPEAARLVSAPGKPVQGSYLVVLRPGEEGQKLARRYGAVPRHVHSAVLSGFAATLTERQVERIRRDPAVGAVEQDQVVTAGATELVTAEAADQTVTAEATEVVTALATQALTAGGGLSGLDRIDQGTLPLNGAFRYGTTAPGVTAYVIDSGIDTSHPDFGGRALNVADVLGGNGEDCNGHGTHVAGTLGAATYGVAKGVALRGVRVLGCDGSGSTAGIVAALDFVRQNAVAPAVANLSLGGGFSPTLNSAVTALSDSGVFVAVAAGNENADACTTSPASAAGVVVVAASDRTDTRASFSNHGSCVDLYAPGVDVQSTWLAGATATSSGTSMSSPHVAGVAALYKARLGDAPSAEVADWIIRQTAGGLIKANRSGTPNRMLYKWWL